MTQTIEERLQAAKAKTTSAQTKRIQLETKFEGNQTRKKELLDKCTALGIDPDTIGERVKELRTEIEEKLDKIEEAMPSGELPL